MYEDYHYFRKTQALFLKFYRLFFVSIANVIFKIYVIFTKAGSGHETCCATNDLTDSV